LISFLGPEEEKGKDYDEILGFPGDGLRTRRMFEVNTL
jgi:hypothetical protein